MNWELQLQRIDLYIGGHFVCMHLGTKEYLGIWDVSGYILNGGNQKEKSNEWSSTKANGYDLRRI